MLSVKFICVIYLNLGVETYIWSKYYPGRIYYWYRIRTIVEGG
jgi:hypothetical protein